MKKSYWTALVLILSVFVSSCKKSGDNNSSFMVIGVSDVPVAPRASDGTMQLYVTSNGGSTNDQVTFSMEGLPAGCSYSVSPAQGTPPFTASIHLIDTAVVPGTYPVKLVGESTLTGKQTFPFNLIASKETDYRQSCLGSYVQSTSDCHPGQHYEVDIVSGQEVNKIYLDNIDNEGNNVYGYIYESGNTIVIPTQTVRGVVFSGSGTIHHTSSFTVHLTTSTAAGPITCTIGIF